MTLKLKVGEEQTKQLQQYSSMRSLINQAFGDGDPNLTGGSGDPHDNPDLPQTAAEAVMRFQALFQ